MSESKDHPLYCGVLDEEIVNQWFDYLEKNNAFDHPGKASIKREIINRLRAACLSGVRKGKRNKAAVDLAVADRLEAITRTIREPGWPKVY